MNRLKKKGGGGGAYSSIEAILNSNMVLHTSQKVYLVLKPAERIVEEKVAKQPKAMKSNSKVYNDYSDREKEGRDL